MKQRSLHQAIEHLNDSKDEAKILEKSLTVEYRKRIPRQQCIAMMAIDDIFLSWIDGYIKRKGRSIVKVSFR